MALPPNQKNLKQLQDQARIVINKNMQNSKIKAIDQQGVKQNLDIKEGEPRPENIIALTGESANIVAQKLGDLYGLFREKEFETLVKTGRGEEANKYFFGVLFPREYRGNTDPLTMTEEQFSEAQQCLKKDDPSRSQGSWAKSIRAESVGEKTEDTPGFHAEKKADWLKEILKRPPPSKATSFADRLQKESSGRDL